MIQNEKARPTVGAAEQAGKAAAYGRAAASNQHCTPSPMSGQTLISDFLSAGQENAVSLQELRQWTGIDGRIVRLMIQRERLAGIPILADCQTGYYLPATQEEKQRCVRSMRHRAKEIYKAAQAIEAADIRQFHDAERLEQTAATGQMQIDGM